MSAELEQQYNLLQNELGALGYRLNEYQAIFVGTSPQRLNLYNRVAPVFFRMLYETMWGDILMHLTRVTGPTTTLGKYHNLTLNRLPDLVAPECRDAVQAAVTAAVDAAKFAGPARNKVYAHTDLGVVKDPEKSGVVLGSVTEMREAVALSEAALDAVASYYGANRGTYFHNLGWGIAEDLLRMVELGDSARYAKTADDVTKGLAAPPPPSE
jgi:hypothetical protein